MLETGKCSMVKAIIGNEIHFDVPDIKSFWEQIILSLVQSALLGWFGGLASLKHYGNKALWQYGNEALWQ